MMSHMSRLFMFILIICNTRTSETFATASEERINDQECEEANIAQVELLQIKKDVRKGVAEKADTDAASQLSAITPPRVKAIPSDPPEPNDYMQAALPVAWTHVPKCGTSFLNSVVRLPGVCPGLPVGDVAYGADFHNEFPDWKETCTGLYSSDPRYSPGLHINVGSAFETVYRNHGLIMLRQPEQRLISMYNHANHGGSLQGEAVVVKHNMTLIDFANATAGCAVRMLTKDGSAWAGCMGVDERFEFTPALEVSVVDAYVAKKRLREYAFVGITDYWPESICLLHAMFGGDCNPAEFQDVRQASATAYDVSVLEGFVDQYDGMLYDEALSMFTENLGRYRVSQKSCQRCFRSGGLSASDQEETFVFRAQNF